MDGERIAGIIIMSLVSFGCGVLFFLIGVWAKKSKTPMHFYSGIKLDPNTISDIPAYNRENSRLWKQYSLPYFLSGVLAVASAFSEVLFTVSTVLVIIASTLGIFWLIWHYQKIGNKYIVR